MKHPVNEDFKEWIEFLKKNFQVKYSDAGQLSGIGVTRVSNIRYDRTQATVDDFKKLAIAFPALRERAKELGIDYYPTAPDQVMHLSEPQANELGAAMLDDIRKAMASKDARIEHLEAEVLRLHGIIDHLMGKT